MTCSTSAVAVCCSSASLVSLNSRTFSIAITAWSAKVSQQPISLSAKRPHRRRDRQRWRRSTRRPAASARPARCGSRWRDWHGRANRVVAVEQRGHVVDMHRHGRSTNGAADHRRAPRAASATSRLRFSAVVEHAAGHRAQLIAVQQRRPELVSAGPAGATQLRDRLEHRLRVGDRTADDRSTSAVAVCCSSASLVSLNRRAFWIAITAWSAKVREQRQLLRRLKRAAACA